MNKQPVVLLGGHLSPAQAVAEYIKRHQHDIPLYFIGRKQAFHSPSFSSTEEQIMSLLSNVMMINPPRSLWPWQWHRLLQSFLTVFCLYLRIQPRAVVCFGSYVALPAVLAAAVLRIPLVVHEQTRSLSRMNQFAARFARYVCVSDDAVDVGKYAYKKKATGFPLRPSLFDPLISAGFSIPIGLPVIIAMGGTTGALSMNKLLFPIIEKIVSQAIFVHLTGELSIQQAKEVLKSLPIELQSRYVISAYCSSDTMRWLYKQAVVAVTRTGANTVYELLAFHIPAVCIPLPWSQNGEQQALADWYTTQEQGIVIDQQKTNSEAVFTAIQTLITTRKPSRAADVPESLQGTEQLVKTILGS